MSARYWLSRKWAICCMENTLVCLNVKTRQHVALDAPSSNAVARHVVGWPMMSDKSAGNANEHPGFPHAVDAIRSLLDRGVLVHKRKLGRDPTPVSVPQATAPLLNEYEFVDVKIKSGDAIRFARAAIVAGLGIQGGWLLNNFIIRQFQSASLPVGTRGKERSTQSLNDARRALALFLRLRPILWKTANRQLFEQFVLFKFLHYQGISALWVIGISLDRGMSHSWLQFEDFVMDDVPTRTSRFTPIVAF